MAQQLESIKIAAEHRKIIHEIFATRDDEAFKRKLQGFTVSFLRSFLAISESYYQALCLENTLTELIKIGNRATSLLPSISHTASEIYTNHPRRIAKQVEAAGIQLVFLCGITWAAALFKLGDPNPDEAEQQSLRMQCNQQIMVLGLVAVSRDMSVLSCLGQTSAMQGLKLLTAHAKRLRDGLQLGSSSQQAMDDYKMLSVALRLLVLMHLLAMVNYDDLWPEDCRKAVLDIDIPAFILSVADKALTCAPMIAPRDSNENQRLWMMLDHALKDAHIGLLVQLSCGVSSAEVKESMLMDNFARNHDTLAVLMHRRTELYPRHGASLANPVLHTLQGPGDTVGGSDADGARVARILRSQYAPYTESKTWQAMLETAHVHFDSGRFGKKLGENTFLSPENFPALDNLVEFYLGMPVDFASVCFGCGKLETRADPFKKCAYCPTATYCSSACQKIDWKAGHKNICAKPNKQSA